MRRDADDKEKAFQMIAGFGAVIELENTQESVPQAIWTAEDTTLTFYYGPQVSVNGIFDEGEAAKIVTRVWSGTSVTDNEDTASWSSIQESVTRVVIDDSFANVKPTSTAYWFEKFHNLTNIEGLDNLNTQNVTNMSYMFWKCSSLTSLDVSGFETENVTQMRYMFYDCNGLERIFCTDKTENWEKMDDSVFLVCTSLKGVGGDGGS